MRDAFMTKKILSYIENNLDKDLTLEKIAKELHYSKFYMARAFKEHTGRTLYQYIQGRRMEEAARKLAETERPIVEIAMEAGYGSQQAFTRSFHHRYGCAPGEYRKNVMPVSGKNEISMRLGGRIARYALAYRKGRAAA